MFKKWFTPSAFLLLLPLTAQAIGIQVLVDGQAVTMFDVPQSAWFATYVQKSAEAGIVSGYKNSSGKPTGKFKPENNITVAEALKIASEGAGYDEQAYATTVPSGVKHWASAYVSVALGEHFPIVQATSLERSATRAEVAALFAASFRTNVQTETINQFTDVDTRTEYATSIEALNRDGVITGDTDAKGVATGTFRPAALINRAEVAKMVIRAREVYGTPGKGRGPGMSSSSVAVDTPVVSYTNAGFTPQVLHVKKGTLVTFKNESSSSLLVASDPHPQHTALPSLTATKMILQGDTYSYTFTQVGTWGYHNHLSPTFHASVVVSE